MRRNLAAKMPKIPLIYLSPLSLSPMVLILDGESEFDAHEQCRVNRYVECNSYIVSSYK